MQTARSLLPKFAGGVWLIDFAPLVDPVLVVQVAATVLGVREQPARTLSETLADHLRHRQVLLIFDNCEHLVAACAQLVTTLLQTCPDLRILATSREPLGVTGEVAWIVPPLSLPGTNPGMIQPAARPRYRFTSSPRRCGYLLRARQPSRRHSPCLSRTVPGWQKSVVAWMECRWPLNWRQRVCGVLSVREIAQRLDDRFALLTGGSRTAPPRQQTLAATLDWSYKLLAEAERAVLQRLAVFAGGCTLAAAGAVCSDEAVGPGEVLDVMSHLVDKSLVVADPKDDGMRYRLLETIRQYAREKLLESGEAEKIQERHCAFFVEWAEQAETHLNGPRQIVWLGRYEVEHDNLRAALDWCRGDKSRSVVGLRLATACAPFLGTARLWGRGHGTSRHGAFPGWGAGAGCGARIGAVACCELAVFAQ